MNFDLPTKETNPTIYHSQLWLGLAIRVTLLFKLCAKRLSLFRPSNKLITLKTNSKRCKLLLFSSWTPLLPLKRAAGAFFVWFGAGTPESTCLKLVFTSEHCLTFWTSLSDNSLRWICWTCEIRLLRSLNMAEELQRADSNLRPSELKAAFKRSRDIDALLDEERELKEREVQLLILGKHAAGPCKFHSCYYDPGGINISSFIFSTLFNHNPRSYFTKPGNENNCHGHR